jgi:hypothetical protein
MDSYDISRVGFDPQKHYSGVRMQQGRVQTDDDWNESERIENEAQRRTNINIIGSFGTSDDGFHISNLKQDNGLTDFDIDPGTLFLGGLPLETDLVDNGSGPVPETYRTQRDWLQQPPLIDPVPGNAITSDQYDLVYLEAWQQAVCAVEDEELFEVALGGPDTSFRIRNHKRVRIMPDVGFAECPDAWQKLIDDWKTVKGKINENHELETDVELKVSFQGNSAAENLCSPSAISGYLGADNQAIRVQLINGNHFTWGFDDAAPLYRVTVTDKKVKFLTEPKDQFHWPLAGQIVEILPWSALLPNGEKIAAISGFLSKVNSSYDPDTSEITLVQSLPADFGNAWQKRSDNTTVCSKNAEAYFYLRVWNRGTDVQSTPAIPFIPGTEIPLGNTGLAVTMTGTNFHTSDYWIIAARPNSPDKVVPWKLEDGIKPHGIRRFIAPLAIIHWYKSGSKVAGEIIHDCRKTFRPLTDQEGCCTYTVGDGKRSKGDFISIEEAVENLPISGGKICVLPGEHETNLEIINLSHIWISGCDGETIVRPHRRNISDPIFTIEQSSKIKLTGMSLVALYGTAILIQEDTESDSPSHDITISDNQILAYENAIKINPAPNINITEIHIINNQIAMVDSPGGGAGIFTVADDVSIIRNDIAVVPKDNPVFAPLPGKPLNPVHIIYDPCADPIASYELTFPLKNVVSMMMKYITGINMMHVLFEYQTLGGIQIGGSSERVRIIGNKIIGGSGNGITLGHLPEIIYKPIDQPTDTALSGKNIKSYSYIKTVITEPFTDKIYKTFDDEFLSSLYDIDIEENHIRSMGLSGIGVVTFFSIKALGRMVIVNDLTIYRNTITDCAKQIPWDAARKLPDEAGFGGISLAGCTKGTIRENRIENNGNSDSEPICGVFIMTGEKLDISGNRILNNGPLTATIGDTIIRGNRAGVFIKNASKQLNDYSTGKIQLSDFDGVPAVKIHDNIITQPLGQALYLVALGPVSIVGNILTSQGTHPMNPTSLIAGSVFILDLGISKDLLAARNIPRLRYVARTSSPYYVTAEGNNQPDQVAPGLYFPGGNILFNDNQTTLDLRRSEVEICLTSQLMVSLDDISYNSNQSDVMSYSTQNNRALDVAIVNVFLIGFSVRTNSTRFQEGSTMVFCSLFSLGYINTAVGNQASHCLHVLGNRRANQNNIILHGLLCQSAHEEIIAHTEVQPATMDRETIMH